MDDTEAEAIEAYAAERGLTCTVLAEQSTADLPPEVQARLKYGTSYTRRELTGKLPGGLEGSLRVESYALTPQGETGTAKAGVRAVVKCAIPDSQALLPTLIIQRHGFGAGSLYVTSQLFGEAPDARARKTVLFESVKLGERFDIQVDPGQDEMWLYEVFPPSFIDWLAEKAPHDLIAASDRGNLYVEVPHLELAIENFDNLCEIASTVGGRIVQECDERTAAGLPLPIDPTVTRRRLPGGATIYATAISFMFTLVLFGFIGFIAGLIAGGLSGGLIGAAAIGLPFALLVGYRNYAGAMGKYDYLRRAAAKFSRRGCHQRNNSQRILPSFRLAEAKWTGKGQRKGGSRCIGPPPPPRYRLPPALRLEQRALPRGRFAGRPLAPRRRSPASTPFSPLLSARQFCPSQALCEGRFCGRS